MSWRLLAWLALAPHLAFPGHLRAEEGGARKALLIGVTAYPHVGREFQLQGPANDVTVIARVLCDKFGFRDDDLLILSEQHGRHDERKLPTRKNIEAAFTQLGKGVRPGDQVVVFLAGHGTELPTPTGPVGHFLPRDVAPWTGDGAAGGVPQAIAGTEIGRWLRPVAEQRANLWVIVDACFTGRMVRGSAGAIRQLPTDPQISGGLRVPPAAVRPEAVKRGAARRTLPIALPEYEGVACLYACSPDEVTLEERTVAGDAHAPVLGLLTRALGDVLLNASSDLTYRELHGQIRKFYAATGRTAPTPVLEGSAINRTVLQSKLMQRKAFLVSESDDGALSVNAGLLHGLTVGSVLSVHPPPGQGDALRGYVKLTQVGPTSAACEPHAPDAGPPAKKAVLIDGRAEVQRIEFGENRFPLALDPRDDDGRELLADVSAPLRKILQELEAEEAASFRVVDAIPEARLLLHYRRHEVCLLPSLLGTPASESRGRVLAAHAFDEGLRPWLRGSIERVARAHALLRLHVDAGRDPAVKISTELLRLETETSPPGALIPGPVKQVHAGDLVAYEIKNQSTVPVDVTLLYLDADLGIEALFPGKNEPNRVLPEKSLRLPVFRVQARVRGLEYAVIVAVENHGKEFVELTALAPARRSLVASRMQLDTPLGQLLEQSLTGREKRRSASQSLIRSYTVDLVPIEVLP